MKKFIFIIGAIILPIVIAQPVINSVSDSPDPVEVPGYNNITADITGAISAYVEIYYPNSTLKGNYSMTNIPPTTWYYNSTYAYPAPLGTYTYIVKAYDGVDWAESSSYTFTLQDTTSPSSSVAVISPYWRNSSVLINASATDNYAISNVSLWYRYSTDNSSWGAWTFFEKDNSPPWQWNFNFPDGEGYYEFYSIANDTSGNTESKTNAEAIAGYDASLPSSSVNSMAYWYSTLPVVITATANDALSGVKEVTLYYRYSANNASWGTWNVFSTDNSPPWQWNFNAPNGDGYYQFYSIAKDNANNIETIPPAADAGIGIDTHSPTTTINPSGGYVSPSSPINLTATDAVSGVNSTYYRIWNGSWNPAPGSGVGNGSNFYLYSGNFTLVTAGTNYVEFYSDDIIGNEETIHNVTFTVDNVPPSISGVSINPQTQVSGGYVNISCNVADVGAGVDKVYVVIIYPCGLGECNFSMNYIGCQTYYLNQSYITIGTYQFRIVAHDKACNWAQSSIYNFTITGPNSPPITSCILDPSTPDGENGWYLRNVNVTLNATDPDGDAIAYIKYRIDGESWINYNGTFTISEEGDHLLEFYSADNKGNIENIKSVYIKIDKSKPFVTLERPMPGYLYLFDRAIWPLATGNTVIIGRIVVRAIAIDTHSSIANVSFYVNGYLQSIDPVYPYEWIWRGWIGYAYLHVVAYNKAGLSEETEPLMVYMISL
ncbi:MAG: hypothetical protein H5T44_00275 [Thermoplasmatales archaeon]|nr:hypothetical protein [Thermoplasmatales archaeon]